MKFLQLFSTSVYNKWTHPNSCSYTQVLLSYSGQVKLQQNSCPEQDEAQQSWNSLDNLISTFSSVSKWPECNWELII